MSGALRMVEYIRPRSASRIGGRKGDARPYYVRKYSVAMRLCAREIRLYPARARARARARLPAPSRRCRLVCLCRPQRRLALGK
eukprot:252312-Prymnesium_polylepis.1